MHSDTSYTKTKTTYSVDYLVLDYVAKVLPSEVCLSARILADCRSRRYRFIQRYLNFCRVCLSLCFVGKKNLSNGQIMKQGKFQMHFHPSAGQEI